MHIKNLLLILLAVAIIQGCKSDSEEKVTIQGQFTNLNETKLYIFQILHKSKPLVDSISTNNKGEFSISLSVPKPGCYVLQQNNDNGINLIISPGENISLTGDGKNLNKTYTVTGSKDSELYAEYNNFTQNNLYKVDSLSRIFKESQSRTDFQTVKKRLDAAYLDIFNDQKKKVTSFVDTHSNSLASLLVILEKFGPNTLLSIQTEPEPFLKLDSILMLTYPENSLVNTFHIRVLDFKAEQEDIRKKDSILKPGMTPPEIILPNASGKEIKLSSLKGKLTLVYFWSSWNALSRQTNMSLSTLYNKYQSRGFEIFAVSVDSDSDMWKKAYLIDRGYWVNVIDTLGLNSEYSKKYGVRALPAMILIDREGTIISRLPELNNLETLIKRNL